MTMSQVSRMIVFYFITRCVVQFHKTHGRVLQVLPLVSLCRGQGEKSVYVSCHFNLGVCDSVIEWTVSVSGRGAALAM